MIFQDMIDATGDDFRNVPRSARKVAFYLTGSGGIAWSPSVVAAFRKRGVTMIPIDQSDSTQLWRNLPHLVKDCEPGASSNLSAVEVALGRHKLGLRTTLYTFVDNWKPLLDEVKAHAGLVASVDWWIADWNLTHTEAQATIEANAHINLKAIQWASPTSNPGTIAPGTHSDLRTLNLDLSVTEQSWPEPPKPKPAHKVKPHPKVIGAAGAAAVTTAILGVLHGAGLIHLTPAEYSAITTFTAGVGGWSVPSKR